MQRNWFHGRRRLWQRIVNESTIAIESSAQRIEAEIANPSKVRMGLFAARLHHIASQLGRRAICEIETGIATGWQTMAASLDCSLGAFKVRHAAGFPARSGLDTTALCTLICTAFVLEALDVCDWLLKETNTAPGKPYADWDAPFECLTLGLAQSIQNRPLNLPVRIEDTGYGGLWNASGPIAFSEQLKEADSFRGDLTDESKMDFPPFEYAPFDLFAIDILALAKFRGITISELPWRPEFLNSPINCPPNPFPFVREPIVEKVMSAIQNERNVADVWWC